MSIWETAGPGFLAFLQVIVIDVVLAGDNALVVGLAAARLPRRLRARAILLGSAIAVVLRIGLAVVALKLLAVVGLTLAGGLLLLWVCWKLFREVLATHRHGEADVLLPEGANAGKTMRAAIVQIVLADVSMSLDNVLAVAGAAREHPTIMAIGLLVSVGLMGAAASLIARLLQRLPWLAWIGVAIILFVAVRMMLEGSLDLKEAWEF